MSNFVWNTYNPSTESVLNTFTTYSEIEVEGKLNQAAAINHSWKDYSLSERVDGVINFAKKLRENRKVAAEMMALEMGKPILQGLAEVDKCIATCDYYAEHDHAFLAI